MGKKTPPAVARAEMEKGFEGAKEFIKRNPDVERDPIKNFEIDLPKTQQESYARYTAMARAN